MMVIIDDEHRDDDDDGPRLSLSFSCTIQKSR